MMANPGNILSDLLTIAKILFIDFICCFFKYLWSYFGPKLVNPMIDVILRLELLHLDILTGCSDENWRVLEGILVRQIQNRASLHFSVSPSSLLFIVIIKLFSVFHRVIVEVSTALLH